MLRSKIEKVNLTNYRCFDTKKIEFTEGINVLIGDNATGKTSIVEAVGYLGIGKSFKNTSDNSVIKKENKYFSIVGELEKENKKEKVVIYVDEKGKKININNQNINKLSEFIGKTCLVSFSPDDLSIIKGSPKERRKFLDSCLCQLYSDYLDNLSNYNKIIKCRNEILKKAETEGINYIYLDVLDEKISYYGKLIVDKREKFIIELNLLAQNKLNTLSKRKDTLTISYSPKTCVNNYEKEVKNRREHDIYLKTTTTGPQRDDFLVELNNKIAFETASQGQIRSIVIAMKLAFFEMISKSKEFVIIILDDVLSELDEDRQNSLFELIKECNQTFITSTSIKNISNDIIHRSNVINIGKE